MTTVLGPENFHGGFHLCQGCHEIDLRSLTVGMKVAGAQRLALAHAGIDDHAINPAQLGAESIEHREHLIIIRHVEWLDQHPDIGVFRFQFCFQFFQSVHASCTQCQIAPLGGEDASHTFAKAGAGAGDEDVLADGHGFFSIEGFSKGAA